MNLYAISDLHLDHRANRDALDRIPGFSGDWLILGGDICSSIAHLEAALVTLTAKFEKIIWVPGNHELWMLSEDTASSSVEKYQHLVETCRRFGVSTPEDPYPACKVADREYQIAPLFLLYDYSFSPSHVNESNAVEWATESGVLCLDEHRIDPSPFASKAEWCSARLEYTEQRLSMEVAELPLILVNHFPLRYDLSRTMRIPRFSIWCGTRRTESWHKKFRSEVVVSGHLHMRATDFRDGVRFEEVSLGYPRDWNRERNLHDYFRKILPYDGPNYHHAGPFWKFRI